MGEQAAMIRVALIGYGFAGRVFHAPLLRAVPGLSLDVVGSRDAARVRADLPDVEVIDDYARAATDPRIDLVVIASPNDSHVPLARSALEADKHVVVDKPFTPSLGEARALADLARQRQRMLSVFHNRRWDSDYLAVRQALADGLVGDARHFESRIERFRPEVRSRWREQAGPGTGLWWDLGPHLVDQVLQLFGLPDTVQASLAIQRDGAETPDWAHVVLGYGERRAILQAGMLAAAGSTRFTVHGRHGSLVKAWPDPQESQLIDGKRPGDPDWGVDTDPLLFHDGQNAPRRLSAPRGDQSRYYTAVADALRGQGDNPVPPVQAIAVMAVLEAAIASAEHGRVMTPALDDDERAAFVASCPGVDGMS
jgi:predicted dehydrogenase